MLYITGITGHSGSWFLKRLESGGYPGKIRCVMKNTREKDPLKYSLFEGCHLDIEFCVGNLKDENFLLESLIGVHTIVHIAGITLSPKIIGAAMENGVNWAILVHTTGRFSKYKSASSRYVKIEDDIKALCADLNQDGLIFNYTILRPTMIYGSSRDRNMYRLVDYLSKHKFFPMFGNGKNLMQPVHARDLGNAYYNVLLHPERTMNKEYNLSGKNPITYAAIIDIICSYLGHRVFMIKIPISLSILAARLYNILFKKAVITVEQVMRLQEDKVFGHEEAEIDFAFNPISFEEGIKGEVQEYRNGVRVDYTGVKYL